MTVTDVRVRPARGGASTVFASRRYHRPREKPSERWVDRRIGMVWTLLVLNALTFFPGVSFLHIPGSVGKVITQGALPLALLLAISVNRKLIIRPNAFLFLLSMLIFGAIITSFQPQHLGTVYRTFRLMEFIAALWLLTPWWGRRDLLLLRCHLTTISVLLCTVIVGLLIAPGRAMTEGRLTGVVWPVPPTQVAHYAAVTTGIVLLMWFCGRIRGRRVIAIVAAEVVILILTHTRTALLGLIVGLVVAGLSLVKANTRIRKVYMTAGILAGIAGTTMSAFILSWASRGEGTNELLDLTGRTLVWGQILGFPRNKFQEIFGFGLSNSSFNGLPIDSNWLSSYDELGLFGVCVCVAVLIFLLVNAYFQPRSMERALALFLIVYCVMASFTETGITDVSPYMLEVTLAASMMVPHAVPSAVRRWRPTQAAVRGDGQAVSARSPIQSELFTATARAPIRLTPADRCIRAPRPGIARARRRRLRAASPGGVGRRAAPGRTRRGRARGQRPHPRTGR
jgi:hypothetical protein